MVAEADFINGPEYSHTSMPGILQKSMEDALSRRQDKLFRPRLTLKGFTWGEEDKFPKHWEVAMEQWW